MENPKRELTINGLKCVAKYAHYGNGRTAIQYMASENEVMSVLTVNLPNAELKEDEFAIKNWSENEQTAKAAMKSGVFEDTGEKIRTGFVEAPIWRFAKSKK